ncbi:MAG TPA: glycosyltransferase [Rhodospirillales bacterium]|nr:glycosyltransferase [Rhodospirillales bacterium]
MMEKGLRDPLVKGLARRAYRLGLGVHERLSAFSSGGGLAPKLYYGGARAGDEGGPKVKIKKLNEAFPERSWSYNLVYVLSNAPYLPPSALRRLKARGVPIVGNQDGAFYPAWCAGDWEAENRRMAEQYHLADYVFHQSEFCRRSAEKFLGARSGARDGASEVLHNAVDTSRFKPLNGARTEGGPFIFLLAGKVQAHQAYRIETSARGVAGARKQGLDARLVVAGAIDPLAMAAAAGMAEFVSFHGPYSQQQAPALFASADAYIMTNHNDACPSSVIEAMASGLPVVYAKSGGVPELVGEEGGVALETGESWEEQLTPSAEAVAEGMLKVAENHASFAAAARARAVERFHIAPWLERHRQVFNSLLKKRAA